MVHSEKVFLPLRGQQEREDFALFGLDEQAIQAFWVKIQDEISKEEIGYTMISTTENCAGMALRILLAGGSADFVPFKSSLIVETPSDVHNYALALQRRIDQLNQQSAQIKTFYQLEKQNLALNLTRIKNLPSADTSVAALRENINQAINEMPSAERKRFSTLKKAVQAITSEGADQKTLMKAGISLVESLSDLLRNPPSPQIEAVSGALFSAAALRELLESMMKG